MKGGETKQHESGNVLAMTQAEYDAKMAAARAAMATGDLDGMVAVMNLTTALDHGIIKIVRDDR